MKKCFLLSFVSIFSVFISTAQVVTANAGPNVSLCSKVADGEGVRIGGTPTATGTYPPFAYSWSPDTGLSSNTSSNPIADPDSTTTYYLTVTDNKGNQAFDSVTVTLIPVPAPPTLTCNYPSDTICSGDLVAFTATPTVPGDSFQFHIGGSIQQSSDSNTWSTATLADSSVISVFVFKDGCQNYYFSNVIAMRVKPVPYMTLEPVTIFCPGDSITITAVTMHVPPDTVNFWVNSILEQSDTGSTFTSHILTNNDSVWVTASLNGCTGRASNPLVLSTGDTASVSIYGNHVICAGDTDQFTAFPTLPGYHPVYQWEVNGKPTEDNSISFTADSLRNNDTVVCIMTSSASCAIHAMVYSQPIILIVLPVMSAPVIAVSGDTLTSSFGSICEWYLNGIYFNTTQGTQFIAPASGYYQVLPVDYCTDFSDSVYVDVTGVLTLPPDNITMHVFPSPTSGKLDISVTGFTPQYLSIYDMNGRKLNEQKFVQQIDVSELPAGIYFIEVKNEQTTLRQKVVKIN